jgi:hypothetical protein
MRKDDIEQAGAQGAQLFVPPKSAKLPQNRGRELEPKRGDSQALLAWKQRMASAEGKEIYKRPPAKPSTPTCEVIAA